MKLEVGMYCYNETNRKLGIGKIISFQSNNKVNVKYKNDIELVNIGHLLASYNIIDLIQNKDLCEIEFYSPRHNKRVTRLFEVLIISDTYINFQNINCEFVLINKQWNADDLELKPVIKAILTKEQFENNCYKVGDE